MIEAAWGQRGIVWRGWQARVPAWQTIGGWVRRGREVVQLAAGRDLFLGAAGYSEVTADADGAGLAWLNGVARRCDRLRTRYPLPWRLGSTARPSALLPACRPVASRFRVAEAGCS